MSKIQFQDDKTLRQQAESMAADANTAHGVAFVAVMSILFAWFGSAVASLWDVAKGKLREGVKVGDAEKAMFGVWTNVGTSQLRFACAAVRAKLSGKANAALLYVMANPKRTVKGKPVFTIGRLNSGLWGQWFTKETAALRVSGKGRKAKLQVNLHADWKQQQDWHDWDGVSQAQLEAVYQPTKGGKGPTKEERNKARKASEAVVHCVSLVSDALDALKGKGGSRAAKMRKALNSLMAEFGPDEAAEKATGKAKKTMRQQARKQTRKAKAGRVRDNQPAESVNNDETDVAAAAEAN